MKCASVAGVEVGGELVPHELYNKMFDGVER